MENKIPDLVAAGINSVWLPPQCKATGVFDVGYGIYDLYDLENLTKKASSDKIRYERGISAADRALHEAAFGSCRVVLNHKAGPTSRNITMQCRESGNRTEIGDVHEIEAWTIIFGAGANIRLPVALVSFHRCGL